ncbi:MAG: DUF4860 domain-containing protein [Lentihominibacter sp.]|jgi:hypothetical protein
MRTTKFMNTGSHMIDFIFPVVLLFVFAVSALVITLFAANIYEGVVKDSARNNSARTSLSYVSGKIHAADKKGAVAIGEFDGCNALIINDEINGEQYNTYIYYHDGQLKELFVRADADFAAVNGSEITEVSGFRIEEKANGIYRLMCTDKDGETASSIVGVRSR